MDLWETGRHNLEICVLHSVNHEPERFRTARATMSVQRATMVRSMKKYLTWNYSDSVDIYFGIIPCLVSCVAKLSRDKVKPVYTDQQVHGVFSPSLVSDRFLLNTNIYLYIRSITVSLWSSHTDHELLSPSGMRFSRIPVDVSAHFPPISVTLNFRKSCLQQNCLMRKAVKKIFFFFCYLYFADFSFSLWCKWGLRSSGVSYSVEL
jgi:hypothetical protein